MHPNQPARFVEYFNLLLLFGMCAIGCNVLCHRYLYILLLLPLPFMQIIRMGWCGVVWCGGGVMWWWCDVVWCGGGVVWCGVVWCGVVWCGGGGGVMWCGSGVVVWCGVAARKQKNIRRVCVTAPFSCFRYERATITNRILAEM